MRATRPILSLSLATTALAQYHHHRHSPPIHRHGANLFAGPASIAGPSGQTVTITDNSRTESTVIPEIVVFTDGVGNPVSSATVVVALVPPSDTPLAEDLVQRSQTYEATDDAPTLPSGPPGDDNAKSVSTLAARRSKTAKSAAARPPATKPGADGRFCVAYAPYNADGSCKSASQVMADFGVIGESYGMVRVYGVDCDQIPAVYAAAKANNLKVMYGIFSIDNLGDQIATLTAGINSDWSDVDTVSVGNELVNNGQASPEQMLNAIAASRQLLTASGWTGPVVTVDTFVAALAHPELCSASDYCAVNIHPFFDPNTPAEKAGTFVLNMVQALREKLGNPTARVRVTESGWPWQGSANGQAVPGVDQQAAALESVKAAFESNPQDVVLFSAFNDRWKKAEEYTHYAEQYWGIGTADAPSA
ncbi:Cell surface mannoprotein mp65 [Gnomoniopsis smithogilvyi]|uniref:Cell surface mannoprotein mp65 n=1 Tax=Gnomoniopsis smithogilvyi TaxID=1191159 RepID=A0A9W9CU03_9PEZI|nr:Cell surface mannoprotein mp65 [Gnomoniopsis smithogilvyi]